MSDSQMESVISKGPRQAFANIKATNVKSTSEMILVLHYRDYGYVTRMSSPKCGTLTWWGGLSGLIKY